MRRYANIISMAGSRVMSVGGLFLVGMMALIIANVIVRFFGGVIAGTYELTELLIVAVAAAALGYTALEQSHIAVNIIFSRLSLRKQGILEIFSSVIGIGVLLLITWGSIMLLCRRGIEEETTLLSVPVVPFRFIWVLGLVFFCLVLLGGLFKGLSQAVKK